MAQSSLPRSPSLLWNSAPHGERKGGVSLRHPGHCGPWPAATQRAERPQEGSDSYRQFAFSPSLAKIFLRSVGLCQLLTIFGNRHWQEGQGARLLLITSALPVLKVGWVEWLSLCSRCCACSITTPNEDIYRASRPLSQELHQSRAQGPSLSAETMWCNPLFQSIVQRPEERGCEQP